MRLFTMATVSRQAGGTLDSRGGDEPGADSWQSLQQTQIVGSKKITMYYCRIALSDTHSHEATKNVFIHSECKIGMTPDIIYYLVTSSPESSNLIGQYRVYISHINL